MLQERITKMEIRWHDTNDNFAECARHRQSVFFSSTYCAINAVVAGKARKEENAAAFFTADTRLALSPLRKQASNRRFAAGLLADRLFSAT